LALWGTRVDKLRDFLNYVLALMKALIQDSTANRASFLMTVLMMFANNVVYFTMWAIYFYNFPTLNGWTLADYATMQGVICFGVGYVFFLFGGSWNIARLIVSGELDSYLGRPRSPLLPLLMHECRVASGGDMLSAFVLWMALGRHGVADLPLLLLISLAAGAIFVAVMIAVQSLAFWIGGISAAADNLFEVFLTLSLYPQNVQGVGMKIVLFTAIPAAYIGLLPVQIMRDFSWSMLAAVLTAAIFYVWLAVVIFNRGLRSYTSGNILQR
jgi:ABC-2 type transport system permease protein